MITYLEGNTEIIDAKRSTYSFRPKDILIYPKKADKVTFWCLFGKTEGLFENIPHLSVVSSDQLIKELESFKTQKNTKVVDHFIMRIHLLKKGIDGKGQKLITSFLNDI
jgi:hypothetical protein